MTTSTSAHEIDMLSFLVLFYRHFSWLNSWCVLWEAHVFLMLFQEWSVKWTETDKKPSPWMQVICDASISLFLGSEFALNHFLYNVYTQCPDVFVMMLLLSSFFYCELSLVQKSISFSCNRSGQTSLKKIPRASLLPFYGFPFKWHCLKIEKFDRKPLIKIVFFWH